MVNKYIMLVLGRKIKVKQGSEYVLEQSQEMPLNEVKKQVW